MPFNEFSEPRFLADKAECFDSLKDLILTIAPGSEGSVFDFLRNCYLRRTIFKQFQINDSYFDGPEAFGKELLQDALGSKAVDLMPLVGSSDAFLKALIDGVPGVVAGAVLGSSLSSDGDRGVDGARRV